MTLAQLHLLATEEFGEPETHSKPTGSVVDLMQFAAMKVG